MSKSEIVVAETTVVVTGSLITSITIGSNTYSVSYKESGGNPTVTLVDDHATPRRTEEVVKQVDPLVSCEDACEADANQLCGALILGCNPFFPILTPLLGVLCDDVKDLCSDFGIIQGCARTCSPSKCIDPGVNFSLSLVALRSGMYLKRLECVRGTVYGSHLFVPCHGDRLMHLQASSVQQKAWLNYSSDIRGNGPFFLFSWA